LINQNFLPWELNSSLTLERLVTIAKIISNVRRETSLLHDSENGDDSWSLGCRSYSRARHALSQASLRYDWLRILPESAALRFTFTVGSVPVRFYHGDPEDPPKRYISRTFAEFHQQSLALDFSGSKVLGSVFRMAYELDVQGLVSAVSLVRVDDETGETIGTYQIPTDLSVTNILPMLVKSIDLPPVLIEEMNNVENSGEANVTDKRNTAI
jgi:hypothetical protein